MVRDINIFCFKFIGQFFCFSQILYCLYSSVGSDMRLLCVSRSKGNGIAQLRDQRRKKARVFVVSNGGGGRV